MTESSEPRSRWVSRAARSAALTVVLVWLAWSASLLVYQEIVQQRYVIERPDRVLVWTPDETRSRRDPQRPYLNEDVLNSHVSFDSEYYLSIAVLGYDDPDVTQMFPEDGSAQLALNYAFMPAYPLAMRLVAAPLQALGLEPLAAASVAGRGGVPARGPGRHRWRCSASPVAGWATAPASAPPSTCSSSRPASSWPRSTRRRSSWRSPLAASRCWTAVARCWQGSPRWGPP